MISNNPLERRDPFAESNNLVQKNIETIKGREVKKLDETELKNLANKYNIEIEGFKNAFSAFDEKPEVAEYLARCIQQGKVKNIATFKRLVNILKQGLAAGPDSETPIKIISLWGVTGTNSYLALFKRVF